MAKPQTQYPLRTSGPFLNKPSWPPTLENDMPRALRVLAQIVDNDLCHRCGSCIGICPTSVLSLDHEGYPQVQNLGACTDCDLCVKVCPGDEFPAQEHAQDLFGSVPDIEDMHGHFRSACIGYAKDEELRNNSTSGGIITSVLISMLEGGEIDGALVIVSDSKDKWKGAPLIARTKEELLESTKSKYAIVPTNILLQEIRATPGRYAVVGLPCQIHGVRKAAKLDRRIRERVVITIGLFCHAAVEHEPMHYIWDKLPANKDQIDRFVSRIGKHPGTPHVIFKDGSSQPVYFPKAKGFRPSSMEIINILYRLYTPGRCLTCYDSTSEFADISVGDPWMIPPQEVIDFRDGYSFALARTEVGQSYLEQAKDQGYLTSIELDQAQARSSNRMMGVEKRWRAFRIMETRRRQGHPAPNYGFEAPQATGWQFIATEINMFTHMFCFLKRGRKLVLKLTFSPLGYGALWLNNKKRALRYWLKKWAAKRTR